MTRLAISVKLEVPALISLVICTFQHFTLSLYATSNQFSLHGIAFSIAGCQLPSKGASYDGIVAFTKTQAECDPWVNHPNSKFSFVDGSAINASNFCRYMNEHLFNSYELVNGLPK